ncbi:MAG: hypothetical protein ACWGQW_00610, partial [bacterium]
MENRATEFPKFPTQFTEQEAARLKEIEEEKKKIEQVYQAKFTDEAWSKVNPVEKFARWALPEFTQGLVGAIAPDDWGWDYGYTPEQVQEYRTNLEVEYKELARQEKVTRLLPLVLGSLELAILTGEPIESGSELVARAFPADMNSDFNEEEKNFITAYGQALLTASKEDILSGKVLKNFMGEDTTPLMTPNLEEYFKSINAEKIAPRYITSTVAFSKDMDAIRNALLLAYPPESEEESIAGDTDAILQERMDYYKRWAEEQGLRPRSEDESEAEYIERIAKEYIEEQGQLITLVDRNAVPYAYKLDSDSFIKDDEGMVIGYRNEDGSVSGISLQGVPIASEEMRESALKDLWDAFYLGSYQAIFNTKVAITTTIPAGFITASETLGNLQLVDEEDEEGYTWINVPGVGMTKMKLKNKVAAKNTVLEDYRATLAENYQKYQLEYQEWIKEHPELVPRPEFDEGAFGDNDNWKDPYFWFYTISSQAPLILTALGIGTTVTLATGSPEIGGGAAALILFPAEA